MAEDRRADAWGQGLGRRMMALLMECDADPVSKLDVLLYLVVYFISGGCGGLPREEEQELLARLKRAVGETLRTGPPSAREDDHGQR
jgi:hypothetical protein